MNLVVVVVVCATASVVVVQAKHFQMGKNRVFVLLYLQSLLLLYTPFALLLL